MTFVRCFKQGGSICVSIPKHFRSMLNIGRGDVFMVEIATGGVMFRKLPPHRREREPSPPVTSAPTGPVRKVRP